MSWIAMPINALVPPGTSPAYAAQQARNADAVLLTPHASGSARPLGAWSGRRPGSWLTAAATPGGAITISPGVGVLDVQTPVATSAYRVASDANDATLTLAARHATLARTDIVSIRVDDNDVDSSGQRRAIAVYTQGTAGSGAPSVPARNLRICTILVPSAANGGATVVTMDDVYAVASGGATPVANAAAYPTTPYEGQLVYDMALNVVMAYNGAIWLPTGSRRMGSVSSGADITSSTTTEAIGASQALTLISGRRYRVYGSAYCYGAIGAQGRLQLRYDTSTVTASSTAIGAVCGTIAVGTGQTFAFSYEWHREFVAPSSGVFNIALGARTGLGGGNTIVLGSAVATEITVDDVGV